jgi:hypothetical protein
MYLPLLPFLLGHRLLVLDLTLDVAGHHGREPLG